MVSCAVVDYKLGAGATIGEGCRDVFGKVQEASFHKLSDTEHFSFNKLFENIGL